MCEKMEKNIYIHASKFTGKRRERMRHTSQQLYNRLYRLGNVYPWWFFFFTEKVSLGALKA